MLSHFVIASGFLAEVLRQASLNEGKCVSLKVLHGVRVILKGTDLQDNCYSFELYFCLCHSYATQKMLLSPFKFPLAQIGNSCKLIKTQIVKGHQDHPGPNAHTDYIKSNLNISFFSR